VASAIGLLFPQLAIAEDAEAALSLQNLHMPPGFEVSVYASGVEGARSMTLSPNGTLYVGTRETGNLYAITDSDHDNKGDSVIKLGSKMFHPNGVEFHNGSLYVAEINRVLRYDNIDTRLNNPPKPIVVNASLPDKTHHGQKYIRFGPDGWLYIPIGAPCNCCLQKDERFATLCRMKEDGSGFEIYAKGIRNTVGFDWQPGTNDLYFTDNGRDMLGDDLPPEELNCAPHKGMNFGFPYCHAGEISDPEFGKNHPCSEFVPPAIKMPAHVAPLGVHFYTGKMFPEEYKNCAFVCEHGSWNRSTPIGYRISLIRFQNNKPVKYEPFITGWLQKSGVWGRPVDTLIMPDGAMLISDDYAGVIYRVSYKKP
jgi:glucose/arabinose dehydrogenase